MNDTIFFYNDRLTFYSFKLFNVKRKKYIIINAASAIFEIDNIIVDLVNCEGKTKEEIEEKSSCI